MLRTPIEIVLHLRQHRVELLLKIAQGDAAFAAKDLVVQPLLEVLEPLRLPQLDEPVIAARGEPGIQTDLLDLQVAADRQVDDRGRDVAQIDLFVDERAHLSRRQAVRRLVVDHDRAGAWQVAAAKEPEEKATGQGRGEDCVGKVIGQPPGDFFPPAGLRDSVRRHQDLDRDPFAVEVALW